MSPITVRVCAYAMLMASGTVFLSIVLVSIFLPLLCK